MNDKSDDAGPTTTDSATAAQSESASDSASAAVASTLTDDHHEWASNFCSIDTRAEAQSADDSGGADSTAANQDAGIQDASTDATSSPDTTAAHGAADASDTVANASSGIDQAVGNTYGANADDLVQAGSETDSRLGHVIKDAESVIAGAAVHAVAGAVPFGVFGAAAIDATVAAKADPEQKFWYGVGSTVAGVIDMAAGAVEIGGGIVAALPSGGLSLAVAAEGVNELVAAAEAVGVGAALMTSGSPKSSSGGDDGAGNEPPAPGPSSTQRPTWPPNLDKGRVNRVPIGKEPLDSLTAAERESAAEFYEKIADTVVRNRAAEAAALNRARAAYLRGQSPTPPGRLPVP